MQTLSVHEKIGLKGILQARRRSKEEREAASARSGVSADKTARGGASLWESHSSMSNDLYDTIFRYFFNKSEISETEIDRGAR